MDEEEHRKVEVDRPLGSAFGFRRGDGTNGGHRDGAWLCSERDDPEFGGTLQGPLRNSRWRDRHFIVVAESTVDRVVASDERQLGTPAAIQAARKGRESLRGVGAVGIAIAVMTVIAAAVAVIVGTTSVDSRNQGKCGAEAGAVHEEVAS